MNQCSQLPFSTAEVKNGAPIQPLLCMSSWHNAHLIKQRETLPVYLIVIVLKYMLSNSDLLF
jgi:hypothetical protein